MIIVFSGHIGQCGTGGQAWANMQYLLGLHKLGHEVYYLEDVGDTARTWNWDTQEWTTDPSWPAEYIRACLQPVDLGDRWIYRSQDVSRGIPLAQFKEICAEADLLIMRAVPLWLWRSEYDLPRRKIFIDVDPGFTQFKLERGNAGLAALLSRCDHLFTVGTRINVADCTIPNGGFHWRPTLPPVSLDHWPYALDDSVQHLTTIMRWRGVEDASHNGISYGQKDKEFPKFIDLPRRTSQKFRIALLGGDPAPLTNAGWDVIPGGPVTATPVAYQSLIQDSRAEFSVAKEAYRATRSGWFSDRSVCFLASGRPILVQDSCLDDELCASKAIVRFGTLDDAIEGVQQINSDYDSYRFAAREIATKVFDTTAILPSFLETATE